VGCENDKLQMTNGGESRGVGGRQCPKGTVGLSLGFNPRNTSTLRTALPVRRSSGKVGRRRKGAENRFDNFLWPKPLITTALPPRWGGSVFDSFLGLKPQAWSLDILEGFSGCGAEGGLSARGAQVGKIEEFGVSAFHLQAQLANDIQARGAFSVSTPFWKR
jgi:hypothetical protein